MSTNRPSIGSVNPTRLTLMLWSSLDIAEDGLEHSAVFDYFMHRSKKHKPEKRKYEYKQA